MAVAQLVLAAVVADTVVAEQPALVQALAGIGAVVVQLGQAQALVETVAVEQLEQAEALAETVAVGQLEQAEALAETVAVVAGLGHTTGYKEACRWKYMLLSTVVRLEQVSGSLETRFGKQVPLLAVVPGLVGEQSVMLADIVVAVLVYFVGRRERCTVACRARRTSHPSVAVQQEPELPPLVAEEFELLVAGSGR